MSVWHVNLQLRLEKQPDADVLDALTDALADLDVGVGVDPRHLLSIGITVEARSLRAATEKGERAITAAVTGLDLDGSVVGLETLDWAEFERRGEEPVVPPLASLQDLANILGESKQHTQNLVDNYPEQLPAVAETAAGRIWLVASAERFKSFPRPGRGRPAKTFDQRARELVEVATSWAEGKEMQATRTDRAGGIDLVLDRVITVRVVLRAGDVEGRIEIGSGGRVRQYREEDVPTPRELRAVLERCLKPETRSTLRGKVKAQDR